MFIDSASTLKDEESVQDVSQYIPVCGMCCPAFRDIRMFFGIRLIVKDHSVSEKGNLLPLLHGLLFLNSSKGFVHKHHPTERTAHTMTFITPAVEHWLQHETAQWVTNHERSIG